MPEGRGRASGRLARRAIAVSVAAALTSTVLAAAGALSLPGAVLLFAAVETPLALTAMALNAWRYRALRRAGQDRSAAMAELAGATATRLVRAEVTIYRSLWLWAARRVDGRGHGVHPIGYARGSLGLPLAFGVVTLVEVVALHLLVPWALARTLILLASVYSLLWLLGFVAARITHPHLLTGTQLLLREGAHPVATVDCDAITRAARVRRYAVTTPTEIDGQLYLPSQDGTNIDLHLAEPVTAHLPGLLARQRRRVKVTEISLHIDNPQPFLDLVADTQRERSADPTARSDATKLRPQ